jgi:glycosyltransferase involved in cell wall biosynthesis
MKALPMELQAQYPVTLVRTGRIDPRAKWMTAIYDEISRRIPTRLIRLIHLPIASVGRPLGRLPNTITHIPTNAYAYLLRERPRNPTIISCYDLSLRWTIERLHLADRVLVSTRQVKEELETLTKLPREPEVIHLAVPPSYRPTDLPREANQILFVGSEQARKNVEGLFRIFARILRERPATLVKVGKSRPERDRLQALAHELDIERHIVWRDFVEERELVRLYQTSTVTVVPSFLEGFSMPCLEAMSTGCPLIASNLTAIPEVVDGGGLLLDPRDEEAWADAILRVFQDPAFAHDLSRRGIERSHAFSAERSAEQTLRIYADVWQERTGR